MAPIEPDLSNCNIKPIAIFTGYLLNALGLTAFLSYFVLYGAFKALPPSQATRFRASSRKKYVRIFASLGLLSLGVTWYYMFSFFWLSYRVWALQMGELVPEHFWGDEGLLKGTGGLALGRWLKDTELFRDAWEIAAEKSGRYWWSQQIFLGAAAWSVFLGMEGHRRNIPHLWAFMLLAQTVAVSFAMNLFFIAVLLTPVTSPSTTSRKDGSTSSILPTFIQPVIRKVGRIFAARPPSYRPPTLLQIFPLLACYVGVFLVPFSTSTPSFMTVLLVPHLVLFLLLYLNRTIFTFWDRSSGARSPRFVYRFMAYCSIALHVKQTLVALLDNDPGAHTHRHEALLEYLHLKNAEHRGPIERATTGLGRVFGSLNDHPAVASVGWDVMLCGLSLIVWSAIRELQIVKITGNAGLNSIPGDLPASHQPSNEVEESTSPPSRGSTRSKGTRSTKSPSNEGTRRRRIASTSNGEEKPSLSSRKAAEGEELAADNPEVAAVSWGLFTLGGLGAVASGVLGAEAEKS